MFPWGPMKTNEKFLRSELYFKTEYFLKKTNTEISIFRSYIIQYQRNNLFRELDNLSFIIMNFVQFNFKFTKKNSDPLTGEGVWKRLTSPLLSLTIIFTYRFYYKGKQVYFCLKRGQSFLTDLSVALVHQAYSYVVCLQTNGKRSVFLFAGYFLFFLEVRGGSTCYFFDQII